MVNFKPSSRVWHVAGILLLHCNVILQIIFKSIWFQVVSIQMRLDIA